MDCLGVQCDSEPTSLLMTNSLGYEGDSELSTSKFSCHFELSIRFFEVLDEDMAHY